MYLHEIEAQHMEYIAGGAAPLAGCSSSFLLIASLDIQIVSISCRASRKRKTDICQVEEIRLKKEETVDIITINWIISS